MAEAFPNKMLSFVDIDYQELINQCLNDSGVYQYLHSVHNPGDKLFLPRFVDDSGSFCGVTLVSNEGNTSSTRTVWKVNCPGFIYRSHWKNEWNNSSKIRILACKNENFSSKVFELLNTESSNGNNQSNCMFPIRPGSSTYIMIPTSGQDGRSCLFLPAHGFESTSSKCVSRGSKNIPAITYPADPSVQDFCDIFK